MAVIPVTIMSETVLGWRSIPAAPVLVALGMVLGGVWLVTSDDVQVGIFLL